MVEGKQMDESTSLEEALGEAVEPEQVESQPEATEPAPQEPEATEGSTPEPEESWTKAAVLDERQKRQQYEKELTDAKQVIAQYQGYLQGLTPQQQAEAPKAPDFWTDPEAALSHMREQLEQGFNQRLSTVEQTHKSELLNMSESIVAQTYEDFDEVKAHVLELAKTNPAVIKDAAQSNRGHPWLAVYQYAKKDMELAKVGDLEGYKAKLREELKAEALAEVRAELEASNEKLKSVPTSLVNQSSKGGVAAADWAGPTSLKSILGD